MKQIHFTNLDLEHMKTMVIEFFNHYKKWSKFSSFHSFYLNIRKNETPSNKKEEISSFFHQG